MTRNVTVEWCGLCDALLRSGGWVSAVDESDPGQVCWECGKGWDPVQQMAATAPSGATG